VSNKSKAALISTTYAYDSPGLTKEAGLNVLPCAGERFAVFFIY
jgi:hypothetical protein